MIKVLEDLLCCYSTQVTYFTPQWAAVTTQYWLISEAPQKWNPVLSCNKEKKTSVTNFYILI